MPENEAPKTVILGAGAIGCFVGGLWLNAGLDVRFVGRASVAREINRNGLRLSDYSGWSAGIDADRIDYSTDPAVLGQADLVVLTVKCTALDEAAELIATRAPAGCTVISLLNGVRAPRVLKDALPGREILAGMVPFNVAYLGDGRWHQGSRGALVIERSVSSETLAERFASARAEVELSANMEAVAWGKLLLNLNNSVNALSGLTLHGELSGRGYRRVLAASMREALGVLEAAGIEPARVAALPAAAIPYMLETPDWFFRAVGLPLRKIDLEARSSMADDLAAGRPTEINFLNGEIVTLARRLGREAPVNARIVELVREAETVFRPLSGEELRSAVAAG